MTPEGERRRKRDPMHIVDGRRSIPLNIRTISLIGGVIVTSATVLATCFAWFGTDVAKIGPGARMQQIEEKVDRNHVLNAERDSALNARVDTVVSAISIMGYFQCLEPPPSTPQWLRRRCDRILEAGPSQP
jgi:hypothetical protein